MKGAPSNTLIDSGNTWRPCFLIIDKNPRIRQKFLAPFSLLNVSEIFCFSFILRRSRSAWLLVKGMLGSCHRRCKIPHFRRDKNNDICRQRKFSAQLS